MRHPDVDYPGFRSKFRDFVFSVCDAVDPIINYFNHYYITSNEGFNLYSLGDNNPTKTGLNGHIEIYVGDCGIMPKYIKTPIVRIVYNNKKWNHFTSDYNRTIAVTISNEPMILQRHKLKRTDITKEQLDKFLEFISINENELKKIWYYGWGFGQNRVKLKDPNHLFDWNL